jgi:NAD(P)-dependent dehydrogenase (short-subunit alcohol dehydrogenase family)
MIIKDSVILITGANRGLGAAIAAAALKAGARKVYAGARDPAAIKLDGVEPLKIDVTNSEDIRSAVLACPDVSVLINNAGIDTGSMVTAPDAPAALRAEFEVNVMAPLELSRAFAPTLAGNGGGAIVNILSVLSWLNATPHATYSVTKAAAWSMTNGLRNELGSQGTQVVGVHVGYMDTDMTAGIDVAKASPAEVAQTIFAAIEAEADEVLADETSRYVRAGLSAERGVYLGEPRSRQ